MNKGWSMRAVVSGIPLLVLLCHPVPGWAGGLDSDNDGVCDLDEGRKDGQDTDGDLVPDYLDPDDDFDDIPTAFEDWNGNGDPLDDDIDGNGVPDYLDPNVPLDIDEDGYISEAYGGTDCDDLDRLIHPGRDETFYDGIDEDCGGDDDFDADGDGHASAIQGVGGDDCNDRDDTVFPGAVEDQSTTDRDCDGWVDPAHTLLARGGCDCGVVAEGSVPWVAWAVGLMLWSRRRRP